MSNRIEIPEYKGEPIDLAAHGIRYGFRYDPMEWVQNDESLDAAKVRTFVFKQPKAGDRDQLLQKAEELLAKKDEDGSIPGDALIGAVSMGCSPDRPEIQQALDKVIEGDREEDGLAGIYALQALCVCGGDRHKDLRDASLRKLVARCREPLRGGCPWTPTRHIDTLWTGREFVDVSEAIETNLKWIAEIANEIGSLSYKDPWGFLHTIDHVEHPLSREIALKLLPMLLRIQEPDGGWDYRSAAVIAMLVRCGLLEPLRELPALPADWKVVRSIPTPCPQMNLMGWGGDRLWVLSGKTHEAYAVSADDGTVLNQINIPDGNVQGIGRWNGTLALAYRDPTRVFRVDPETGEVQDEISLEDTGGGPAGVTQVDGHLWVVDTWNGGALVLDPDDPARKPWRWAMLAASWMGFGDIEAADDGIWHTYTGTIVFCSSPLVVKTGRDLPLVEDCEHAADGPRPRLLDYGERPFNSQCAGLAHDGKNLWALDSKEGRICVIEKTESGQEVTEALRDG